MVELSRLHMTIRCSSGMIRQCAMLAKWQLTVSEVRGIEKRVQHFVSAGMSDVFHFFNISGESMVLISEVVSISGASMMFPIEEKSFRSFFISGEAMMLDNMFRSVVLNP